MPTLRLIDPNDYAVLEDGQHIGRIRLARERSPAGWLWSVTVLIPGPPFGSAVSIDDAKAQFKTVWIAFKERVGAEELAKAYEAMNAADSAVRYRR